MAGPLVVSADVACAAWLDGEPLELTARQIKMLALLMRARSKLLSRAELYRGATQLELANGSRAVDMDLWRLRRALGEHASFLRSVRKVGYSLDVAGLERIQPAAVTDR